MIRWQSIAILAVSAAFTTLTYHAGYKAGHLEGRGSGYAAGYSFAINEQADASAQLKQEQTTKDKTAEAESLAYRKQAEAEIAKLGQDATRARQELAKYIKDKRENSRTNLSCGGDALGSSRIDPGLVGVLNTARAKTDPDLRAGRAPDTSPAARADDASTEAQAPTWADLALSDQASSQTYLALATKHDKLVGWVQTYCTTTTQEKQP